MSSNTTESKISVRAKARDRPVQTPDDARHFSVMACSYGYLDTVNQASGTIGTALSRFQIAAHSTGSGR